METVAFGLAGLAAIYPIYNIVNDSDADKKKYDKPTTDIHPYKLNASTNRTVVKMGDGTLTEVITCPDGSSTTVLGTAITEYPKCYCLQGREWNLPTNICKCPPNAIGVTETGATAIPNSSCFCPNLRIWNTGTNTCDCPTGTLGSNAAGATVIPGTTCFCASGTRWDTTTNTCATSSFINKENFDNNRIRFGSFNDYNENVSLEY